MSGPCILRPEAALCFEANKGENLAVMTVVIPAEE